MLGRHVYRVQADEGRWRVIKEGENAARGEFGPHEEAVAEACRLAEADKPSRVTIESGDGTVAEERLFGADLSQELGA